MDEGRQQEFEGLSFKLTLIKRHLQAVQAYTTAKEDDNGYLTNSEWMSGRGRGGGEKWHLQSLGQQTTFRARLSALSQR